MKGFILCAMSVFGISNTSYADTIIENITVIEINENGQLSVGDERQGVIFTNAAVVDSCLKLAMYAQANDYAFKVYGGLRNGRACGLLPKGQ